MLAQIEAKPYLEVDGAQIRVNDIAPDLYACNIIDSDNLARGEQIGEVYRF